MRYLSLFTGIGGLESASTEPTLACEIDEECHPIIGERFSRTDIAEDVTLLRPPKADVVVGGWPCQDLSVAGEQRGLEGERSGLFFHLLRVARSSGASTIVAENVPNLLKLNRGRVFRLALRALHDAGYPFVAWRSLNSRAFGLPHERKRVFLVASKDDVTCKALFAEATEIKPHSVVADPSAAGFYWTGGTQSICYSRGFVPTLKVGSGLSIPSPPAVHYSNTVRKITAEEALKLQGFDPALARHGRSAAIFRMAGNAVSVPVGQWVMGVVERRVPTEPHLGRWQPEGPLDSHGLSVEGGAIFSVEVVTPELCNHLEKFLDVADHPTLSRRAATGVLRRLRRSGKDSAAPNDLLEHLERLAGAEDGETVG